MLSIIYSQKLNCYTMLTKGKNKVSPQGKPENEIVKWRLVVAFVAIGYCYNLSVVYNSQYFVIFLFNFSK